MTEKLEYSVLEIHAEKIRELVDSKKYRNYEDFVKSAIEILLTWESSQPGECIEIMKSLMPFSPEQEAFMKMTMKPDEIKKHFGGLGIDIENDEIDIQKRLAQLDDDHLKLRDNFSHTVKYINALKISKPKNIIPYDGYPLLSGFYSRLLPVKIVITALGHLLERKKDSKVEIQDLRVFAYDIAEEFGSILSKYEKEHDAPRNKKKSTGLPKSDKENTDDEKLQMATKRFKDQFIGKVRKDRITKENHFEGALSALSLIYAFEEEDKKFISLTELGKKFFLMENPIIQGEYNKDSLTKQESDFILNELIPQRELEKKFIDTAISVIKQFQKGSVVLRTMKKDYEKITVTLDVEICDAAREYIKKNPEADKMYNINHLDELDEKTLRKIAQWRLATMGRLSELKIVNWVINEKGDSEYSLN